MELETRVEAWAEDDLEESLVYEILGVDWKKWAQDLALRNLSRETSNKMILLKRKTKQKL